jgi:dihydrofolate reductase/thymidylate synthase
MKVIYARGLCGEFGSKDGRLPWHSNTVRSLLPADMANFRHLTSGHVVIMGKKTFQSLDCIPLAKRINIIVGSVDPDAIILPEQEQCLLFEPSLECALSTARATYSSKQVWVIGGLLNIEEAMNHPECTDVVITHVLRTFKNTSTHVDLVRESASLNDQGFQLVQHSPVYFSESTAEFPQSFGYQIYVYHRRTSTSDIVLYPSPPIVQVPHPEQQYLDLLRDVLNNGSIKADRTGTGTRSVFGRTMTFDLSTGRFPLLTTKRIFFRGVVEELLWIISGSTDTKVLSRKGIHIWDANTSRQSLDKLGLTHYEEGDLGPGYGFQWRHAGAQYQSCQTDYTGQGIDQLRLVVDKLKNHPEDRRILIQSWNVDDLDKMALPPCHVLVQFYVDDQGKLSASMYQRSADLFLGVPFNIAVYSLLILLMAQVCNLTPGKFMHVLGDAHIYATHVEAVRQQLQRQPKRLPRVQLDPSIRNIDEFRIEHVSLEEYEPYPHITAPMAF